MYKFSRIALLLSVFVAVTAAVLLVVPTPAYSAKKFKLPASPQPPFPAVPFAGLPGAATLTGDLEPFSPYVPQTSCQPINRKGIVAFKNLVLSAFPSTEDWGSVRNCTDDGISEHLEGRAWDWHADVNNPDQFASAAALLGWLTAEVNGQPGYWARRLGIMYIGYNHRIWASYRASEGWRVLSNSNPHTDHVHFSFSWNGARGKTSFWKGRSYTTDYGPCTPNSTTPAPVRSGKQKTPCPYVSLNRSGLLWTGSSGSKVLAVQQKLGVSPTGLFGSATRKAVVAYQRKSGLVPNGTVDKATSKSLQLP